MSHQLIILATGTYLNLEWTTCRTCHDSYHLKCLSPPLDHRPNKWRCPACREQQKMIPKEKNVPKVKNDKLFKGVHDDDCYMCFNGGGEDKFFFVEVPRFSWLFAQTYCFVLCLSRFDMLWLLQQSIPSRVPYSASSCDPKRYMEMLRVCRSWI